MASSTDAHRAEFSVRCACGIEYHTSDAHVGKLLPCKCGRKVTIVRPPKSAEPRSRSSSAGSQSAGSAAPGVKRRRKIRKRRYVPGHLGMKFGKGGEFLDRTNTTSLRWIGAQLDPMFNGSPLKRITAIAAWLYLAAALAAWMLLKFLSEDSIVATLIAYGPRFLALWPLALLTLFALIFLRRALWPLAAAAVIIVIPIMGFRVSPGTIGATLPLAPERGTIRALTFNTQNGNALSYDLTIMLRELAPDVFTFQECGDKLWAMMQAQEGWFVKRYGSLCTGSRWEIVQTEEMPREEFARVSQYGFGGTGMVLRTIIKSPMGQFALVNLHLETARRGLEGMLGNEGLVPDNNPFNRDANETEFLGSDVGGVSKGERFRRNVIIRDTESQRASRWAANGIGNMPLLIAGDFNLPVESTIFQAHWGKFTDAFEAKGNGLGWSKHEGRWLRIRIDHLLTRAGGLEPLVVRVVPDYRSDHRPVVADFRWPTDITPPR